MTSLYTATEADIRAWVGDQSFSRSRSYARDGSILNPRRQGDTLKAQCIGSAPQPYRVEVTLGEKGIAADRCSCPIGSHCKHVAALLLTWLHDAASFAEVQEVSVALSNRSKEELIALVTRMVHRYPDLETMLDLPMPGATSNKPIDPKVIERQVNQVFSGWEYEYGASYAGAEQLGEIVDLGRQYAAAGDWRNAVIVYHAVAEGVIENIEYDEEGDLGSVAGECVTALGEALDAVTSAQLREVILRYLFEIYHSDMQAGGYGIADEAPDLILTHATSDEKKMMAQLVRSTMPQVRGDDSGWYRQSMGGFLLALEEETLDDETYLRICRETGQTYNLVERLLSLQRSEEVIQSVGAISEHELLGLEPAFRMHSQVALFARLVAARAPTTRDMGIKSWLRNHAQAEGNLDQALKLSQELFWTMPSLDEYGKLKALATQIGSWPTLHSDILTRLSKEPHQSDLLTRIYLQEEELDKAIALVSQPASLPGWYGSYGFSALALDVARAAETKRPHAAINIYKRIADHLISNRNRDSYASAASYLQTICTLYQQLNQEADWHKLIDAIRQQNPRLRALHDELNRAGL
jgi:uncharacterized Zn finger protein